MESSSWKRCGETTAAAAPRRTGSAAATRDARVTYETSALLDAARRMRLKSLKSSGRLARDTALKTMPAFVASKASSYRLASSHTLSHRGSESVACEGENCKKRPNAENKPVIFGSAAASPAPPPPSSSTEDADACAPAFLRPVVRSNPCFSAATPLYARTSS